MKKIALLLTLAALSTSASFGFEENSEEISQENCCKSVYDAFYLGLGVGFDSLKCDDKYNAKVNRFMGALLLGGGKTINKVYVGVEGEYDFAKKKTDNNATFRAAHPKVSGLAGAQCGSWLAFGKVGAAFNKMDIAASGDRAAMTKSKVGLVAGIGLRKTVQKVAFGIGADYSFGSKHEGIKFDKGFSANVHAVYQIQY